MRRIGIVLVAMLVVVGAGTAAAEAPATIWTDAHDGGGLRNDDGYCCLVVPGGVVVGGESTEATGGVDLLVRRLAAADGHLVWSYRYDGYDDKDVAITDMTWDSVGQLLVTGFIRGCVG